MKTVITLLLIVHVILVMTEETKQEKVECFADLDGDKMDPNNIYKCTVPAKCCQEEGLPSCCTKKSVSAGAWDQFVLWGTLAALILLLAFVMWYCRHDGDCCGNKKGQQGCLCCKRKKQPDVPDDKELEEVKIPPAKEAHDYSKDVSDVDVVMAD